MNSDSRPIRSTGPPWRTSKADPVAAPRRAACTNAPWAFPEAVPNGFLTREDSRCSIEASAVAGCVRFTLPSFVLCAKALPMAGGRALARIQQPARGAEGLVLGGEGV